MKKLLSTLLLLPGIALAHPGGAHTHPEEMTGGLMLLIAAGMAIYLWKRK
ncbi:hypothetical protein L3Q72_14155 [Vibrio sp. JC009]|nr:hypothetical protein [Vibrio sp. JC009]WED21732.1 hypothetical protein L3Q72_14155 [Vibrio sp. JC009]